MSRPTPCPAPPAPTEPTQPAPDPSSPDPTEPAPDPVRGRVVLVGAGPGGAGLMTLDGLRALAEADVVLTDRLAEIGDLAAFAPGAEIVDVGKTPGHHPVPQSKIQDLMFVFNDLIEVDDRGMQEVLRAVPGDKLLLAMKGADDGLKEKIFKNMSQRAAEMMKDDLEARGPVRLSEVARVVNSAENVKLGAWANMKPAIILNVQRQPGANVIATVDAIKQRLPELQVICRA